MTALNSYPTPLTDAQAEHEWHHLATVPASYARDLERKLALCRDALAELIEGIDLLTPDAPIPIEGSVMANAKQALAATK